MFYLGAKHPVYDLANSASFQVQYFFFLFSRQIFLAPSQIDNPWTMDDGSIENE